MPTAISATVLDIPCPPVWVQSKRRPWAAVPTCKSTTRGAHPGAHSRRFPPRALAPCRCGVDVAGRACRPSSRPLSDLPRAWRRPRVAVVPVNARSSVAMLDSRQERPRDAFFRRFHRGLPGPSRDGGRQGGYGPVDRPRTHCGHAMAPRPGRRAGHCPVAGSGCEALRRLWAGGIRPDPEFPPGAVRRRRPVQVGEYHSHRRRSQPRRSRLQRCPERFRRPVRGTGGGPGRCAAAHGPMADDHRLDVGGGRERVAAVLGDGQQGHGGIAPDGRREVEDLPDRRPPGAIGRARTELLQSRTLACRSRAVAGGGGAGSRQRPRQGAGAAG